MTDTDNDKRLLRYTSRFKKDLKRESKGQHQKTLKTALKTVIDSLINDITLPEKYKDHAMTGNWVGYRDCHVKPDLVLIYRKITDDNGKEILEILELARLGSHSELDI